MMKKIIISLAFLVATVGIYGQEEESTGISVDAGADIVSSYVWRGMYQTGVSFQPSLSVSAYGLTLGSWGSTDFSTTAKEVDFYLSYEIKGFSATLSDYWWMGEGESYFKNSGKYYLDSHYLELSLNYTFSEQFPLSLGVNTMFSNSDRPTRDMDENGNPILDDDGNPTSEIDKKANRYYSTYITASYPFSVKGTDCEIGIGISPFKGMYSDKFDVAAINFKASKKLQLTSDFSLPVFVEAILSPARDNAFLVFGLTF